jgi:homoserine O-acetyltransferase/O-succinyltransferase
MNAVILAASIILQQPAPPPPPPTIASLGTCRLTSGGVIPDCRIAYRAFGRLNAARTNGVLIPTWLGGRTEDWIDLLGPNKLVDTTRFYVILVDAFADGRSSSPSNTPAPGRDVFKDLTIADMVDAQHRFVLETLRLPRLHAVMGISMGGMQSFDWAVRYPDFMDVVIPIAGSPKIGTFDALEWTMLTSVIENGRRAGIPDDTLWIELERQGDAFLRTPAAVNGEGWDTLAAAMRANAASNRGSKSLDDMLAQVHAILRQDVSASFGGDMARAAAQVRARMLVVYSWDDHMVTAGPAAEFARLVKADTLAVASACGHLSAGCEGARVDPVVREFLAR